jgi:hypothetical protein
MKRLTDRKGASPGNQLTPPDTIDQIAHPSIGCSEMAACRAVAVNADVRRCGMPWVHWPGRKKGHP